MVATPQTKRYTAEEYLALEAEADTRSEFIDGEIVPMAGGTPEHNAIVSALNALLWFALRGKPYQVFTADQRVYLPAQDKYVYPDVVVVAEPIELSEGRKDTITNPLLIVEVLSDSTKDKDRGDKFVAYRTIPTFREYLLVDQYSVQVEHYVKQADNRWLLTEYNRKDAVIALASVPVELSLADVYENVALPE